jgi:hypothetical protein
MNLSRTAIHILSQLADLVVQIQTSDFTKHSDALQSTIGQHIRHTLEFFLCLENGFKAGIVNYDLREHDMLLETDRSIALETIGKTIAFIRDLEINKPLRLEAGYDPDQATFTTIQTNISRELVYNIEHAVHHMAIIKIGIKELAPYVNLDHNFGIAASTIRYRQTLSTLDNKMTIDESVAKNYAK